jgi:hypothetical protein
MSPHYNAGVAQLGEPGKIEALLRSGERLETYGFLAGRATDSSRESAPGKNSSIIMLV